jgi:ATP-dependent Clp protease ATP-binding subunit ClpC
MIAKVDERLKDRDMGLELLPAARTLLSERGCRKLGDGP